MKFRNDINALRALAVIAVILFHFNENWLPGGFTGVDVFFVISGFLMTSIICKGLNSDSFSLIGFYRARARRIIPALAVVIVTVLIFGWFFLPPIDYHQLGKHSLSAVSFLSNMTFWQEAGYFDAASHEKWLLHTWSLSVEWQFYIFYPIILMLLAKLTATNYLRYFVLIGFIISFIISVYAAVRWPSLAFYSLPTRAWEMLLGGLAFLFPLKLSDKKRHQLELIGLISILFSYIYFNGDMRWPSWQALLPTVGAYFIIIANNQNSIFTQFSVAQWIGKVSYSLYLWHWPVVVAILYFNFSSNYSSGLGIALSVILAALSYYIVEQNPLKNRKYGELIYHLICKRALIIFSVIFSITIFNFEGFYNRDAAATLYKKTLAAKSDWYYPAANFSIGETHIRTIENPSNNKVLFLGDSLVEQYYIRMEHQVKTGRSKYDVWFITNGGCFPTEKITSNKRDCRNTANLTEVFKTTNFDRIVVGGDWHPRFYIDEWKVTEAGVEYSLNQSKGKQIAFNILDNLFNELKSHSKEVYLLLTPPKGKLFDFQYVSRLSFLDKEPSYFYPKDEITSQYFEFNQTLITLANNNGVKIVDSVSALCEKEICSTIDSNKNPIYKDDKHLRASYVKKHVSFLDFVLE